MDDFNWRIWASLALLGSIGSAAIPPATSADEVHHKRATVYSDRYIGKRTASGQVYNPHAKTAAHPSLPFGSEVEVTNKLNGKSLTLHINDRCKCSIDLSRCAAKALGISSTAPVAVKVLSKPATQGYSKQSTKIALR
ncbi:MAG: septal ring lytic transglycosylase RlpA family protein [Candidatus Obscuribacterales bacterium]|nr:septal ring lytic transglycosylase RlpA family protein [Candidatus Obscuribacterales bacterium]